VTRSRSGAIATSSSARGACSSKHSPRAVRLVVVFEDLHWASDTLLDLVEHVTVSRMSTPLVMFALARPELLDRKPNWGGGRRNFTSLGLEPLTNDETRRLVAGLTDGVPVAIADHIVARSGGNPFFAGELVRAYDDRRREGALDADIRLPDTVHATVLARIDGLPAGERAILEYAAVAGRTARSSAIHALVPEVAEAQITDALDTLAERDLLVAHGSGAYTFRHIVIREGGLRHIAARRARAGASAACRVARRQPEPARQRARRAGRLTTIARRSRSHPGHACPKGFPSRRSLPRSRGPRAPRRTPGRFARRATSCAKPVHLAPPEDHLRLLELRGDLSMIGDAAISGYAEAYERWRDSRSPTPCRRAAPGEALGVAGRWSGSLGRPFTREESAELADEAQRLLGLAADPIPRAARLRSVRSRRSATPTSIPRSLPKWNKARQRGGILSRRKATSMGKAKRSTHWPWSIGSDSATPLARWKSPAGAWAAPRA
jgi:hypothetical protein